MVQNKENIKAYIEGDNGSYSEKIYEGVTGKDSYNLLAGLIGAPYYFYRKCYGKGLLLLIMETLAVVLVYVVLGLIINGSSELNNFITGIFRLTVSGNLYVMVADMLMETIFVYLNGYMFYPSYRKKMEYVIENTKKNKDLISECGGTDAVSAVILLAILILVSLVSLATVFRFI